MKLLVINLHNPCDTKYRTPRDLAVFMLGRRVSNYPVFIVDDDGNMEQLKFDSTEVSDIERSAKEALAV